MSQHLCFNPYNRTLDNGHSNAVLSLKWPVSITILEICTLIYIESDISEKLNSNILMK